LETTKSPDDVESLSGALGTQKSGTGPGERSDNVAMGKIYPVHELSQNLGTDGVMDPAHRGDRKYR
jgi:hypothetical protein